jgi:hypothetical protein
VHVNEDLLRRINNRLEDNDAAKRLKFSGEVNLVIGRTVERLRDCPEFTGEVRQRFEDLVTLVIRFIADRANKQKGDGTRFGYLFDAKASEDDLEDDLMDWLSCAGLSGLQHQVIDKAAGRTDILLTFGSFEVNIELKLESSGTTSTAGNTQNLSQAATYQVTDVPLSLLVILNTAANATALPPHLSDNVWVEVVQPAPGDKTKRYVVVSRVIGNKGKPSKLK